MKQPPSRKSGSPTKAFVRCIPFKGQERKLRRWVIAQLVLEMCSYLLYERGMPRRQGGELKQAQGRCKFQDPHIGRCYKNNSSFSKECCAASGQQQRHPREERAMHHLPYPPMSCKSGNGEEKIILYFGVTFGLPCFVRTILPNPKSAFSVRHEIRLSRHFRARSSFLLTPVDLRRFFDQRCC